MESSHPVIQALGERRLFYRPHLRWINGLKKPRKEMKERKPFVTAYEAITQKCPQSWDTPGTAYPLVLTRQRNLLLIDVDGACANEVAEAQERLPTYWHLSHSGIGRHALAFTELQHLYGERHLVFYTSEHEKIEIFFNHPVILTNQHTQLLPLTNCDQEVAAWVNDLRNRYKDSNTIDSNIAGCVGGSNHMIFPPERFTSYLIAYAPERGYPSLTKIKLLRYIWNAPKDPYWHGWMQFHVEKMAKHFRMTPQQLSKHLCELYEHGWISRKYKPYGEYKRLLSVRLNVDEQFFQVGKENEE